MATNADSVKSRCASSRPGRERCFQHARPKAFRRHVGLAPTPDRHYQSLGDELRFSTTPEVEILLTSGRSFEPLREIGFVSRGDPPLVFCSTAFLVLLACRLLPGLDKNVVGAGMIAWGAAVGPSRSARVLALIGGPSTARSPSVVAHLASALSRARHFDT